MKTKVVIIEDELLIAETIESYLTDLNYLVVAKIKSSKYAIETLEHLDFDIALVDINIDGKEEGIDLGLYFHQVAKPYIYLTSYSDPSTLQKVKKTQPDGFIVKPFTKRDLFSNIEVVLSRKKAPIEDQKSRIKLNDGYKQVFINAEDVIWIKAEGVYLEVKTKDNTILQRTSFQKIMELFPKDSIQRVHRSWAVNMKYVEEISKNSLLIQNENIPISKSYKDKINSYIHN
jgi:DNA-binding LytR/AlgR family response regulator